MSHTPTEIALLPASGLLNVGVKGSSPAESTSVIEGRNSVRRTQGGDFRYFWATAFLGLSFTREVRLLYVGRHSAGVLSH